MSRVIDINTKQIERVENTDMEYDIICYKKTFLGEKAMAKALVINKNKTDVGTPRNIQPY